MKNLFRAKRPARSAVDDAGATTPQPEAPDAGAQPPVPAGTDLDKLVGDRPTTQRRGRLRRRLRHLRGVRELLLRDLGGLVFEVHRSGQSGSDAHRRLVTEKLGRMATVDAERRELEGLLDDRRGRVVREPGIGGACPSCGEIYGSDARFCWACGTPVAPGARPPPAARPADLPALGAVSASSHAWVEGHGEEMPAAAPPPPPPPPTAPPAQGTAPSADVMPPSASEAPTRVQPPA